MEKIGLKCLIITSLLLRFTINEVESRDCGLMLNCCREQFPLGSDMLFRITPYYYYEEAYYWIKSEPHVSLLGVKYWDHTTAIKVVHDKDELKPNYITIRKLPENIKEKCFGGGPFYWVSGSQTDNKSQVVRKTVYCSSSNKLLSGNEPFLTDKRALTETLIFGHSFSYSINITKTTCGEPDAFEPFCQTEPLMHLTQISYRKMISRGSLNTSIFVVGFYGNKNFANDAMGRRKYKVKLWQINKNGELEPRHQLSTEGFLKSAEIYKIKNEWMFGVYFTTDGNACFFKKRYHDLEERNLHFEDNKPIREPCRSIQELNGCNRPLCFDPRFDSSFTVQLFVPEIVHVYEPEIVYFIAGNYLFEYENGAYQEPPLKIDVSNFRIYPLASKIYNNVAHCRVQNSSSPLCDGTDLIKASFAVGSTTYHFTVISEMLLQSSFRYGDFETSVIESFVVPKDVDAAWYDRKAKTAYIFIGKIWTSFTEKVTDKKRHWVLNKVGQLSDFGIEEDYIDAAATLNYVGYFFVKGWFYEGLRTKSRKRLSFNDFFDIESACYRSDKSSFEELKRRYSVWGPKSPKPDVNTHSYSTENVIISSNTVKETAGNSSVKWIILVVICAILLLAFLFLCVIYKKRNASHTGMQMFPQKIGKNIIRDRLRKTTTSTSTTSLSSEKSLTSRDADTTSVSDEPVHFKTLRS